MPYSHQGRLDRQAIVNAIYSHFIIERQPAGRLPDGRSVYHGYDDCQRPVACAIGIFDTENRIDNDDQQAYDLRLLHSDEPDVLADIFGVTNLHRSDVYFLAAIQEEHDRAARHAEVSDEAFDIAFMESLALRLPRFACEQGLQAPATQSH